MAMIEQPLHAIREAFRQLESENASLRLQRVNDAESLHILRLRLERAEDLERQWQARYERLVIERRSKTRKKKARRG